jgi:hypothetical protein
MAIMNYKKGKRVGVADQKKDISILARLRELLAQMNKLVLQVRNMGIGVKKIGQQGMLDGFKIGRRNVYFIRLG